MMKTRAICGCALFALGMALSPAAQAQSAEAGPLPAMGIAEPALASPVKRPSPIVSNDELAGLRGGQQISVTNQTLTAITAGNVINGDFIAGNVSLSDSALSSFNGVGNLLINTGAQVSLQTGMNITINVN